MLLWKCPIFVLSVVTPFVHFNMASHAMDGNIESAIPVSIITKYILCHILIFTKRAISRFVQRLYVQFLLFLHTAAQVQFYVIFARCFQRLHVHFLFRKYGAYLSCKMSPFLTMLPFSPLFFQSMRKICSISPICFQSCFFHDVSNIMVFKVYGRFDVLRTFLLSSQCY